MGVFRFALFIVQTIALVVAVAVAVARWGADSHKKKQAAWESSREANAAVKRAPPRAPHRAVLWIAERHIAWAALAVLIALAIHILKGSLDGAEAQRAATASRESELRLEELRAALNESEKARVNDNAANAIRNQEIESKLRDEKRLREEVEQQSERLKERLGQAETAAALALSEAARVERASKPRHLTLGQQTQLASIARRLAEGEGLHRVEIAVPHDDSEARLFGQEIAGAFLRAGIPRDSVSVGATIGMRPFTGIKVYVQTPEQEKYGRPILEFLNNEGFAASGHRWPRKPEDIVDTGAIEIQVGAKPLSTPPSTNRQ